MSRELWPALDSIVKHHQEPAVRRKTFSDLEQRLLETIAAEGSIRTDRLRKKLRFEGRENNSKFHRSLGALESYAMIVGFEDPHPERHLHANVWQTWNMRVGEGMGRFGLSYNEALAKLLEKTIDACVLAREDQIQKWFQWSDDTETAEKDLLKSERIVKTGPFLLTSRILRS